ncbi:hypothetical protein KNN17_13755 [Arthrobacter bambusae]|uniref:hypothetical protein n=1 Tax=Arthrobacter bambusae TaxID=1338426 RepID=UPI001F50E1D0|nr:hypothetical protein [Arthrobacter bambusae]MCI0142640.1 hypothetical protein [Arthrobacter bambusae]
MGPGSVLADDEQDDYHGPVSSPGREPAGPVDAVRKILDPPAESVLAVLRWDGVRK